MAFRIGSLTTLGGASNASAATTSNYLTGYSLSTYSSPASMNCSSDMHTTDLSTARLIDYHSSEEEAETQQVRVSDRCRTKTRKTQETKKYKSAELVQSESDGSNVDKSGRQRRPRDDLPPRLKQATPAKKAAALTESDKMGRMNDYSWGASSSSKKRSLPLTSLPASAKRSKQNPFLVESDSDDKSSGDDEYGCDYDRHIVMAPEQSARRMIGEDRLESGVGNDTLPPHTNLQRHGSNTDLKSPALQPRTSKSQLLNKDRLRMMMAKKQGGFAASSPKIRSSPPDLRNRPLKVARSQQDVVLPALRTAALSSQGENKTLGQSEELLQVHRSRTQDPGSSHATNAQTRTQQTPCSVSNSMTPRKAQTARLQNTSSISSLRNTLDTAKAGHRGAACEPNSTGSEWRKAQVERPIKSAHRPEAGARFGHTLKARKSNTQEKESTSSKGAPATVRLEPSQTSPSSEASLASKQTQSSGSNVPSASNFAPPLNRTSAVDLRQPSQAARQSKTKLSAHQSPFPHVSNDRTGLIRGGSVEPTNNTARGNVADETEWPAPSLPSTRSNGPLPNGEVTSQKTAKLTLEKSNGNRKILPHSSLGCVGKEATIVKEEQPNQCSRAIYVGQIGSEEVRPSQQGATKMSDLTTTEANSFGRALTDTRVHKTTADSVETMEFPGKKSATHAAESDEPPVASIGPGAQPKTPTAVMISPERLGAHTPTRLGSDKSIPPVAPVVDTQTTRTASPSDTTGCFQPSSDKEAVEAGKYSSPVPKLEISMEVLLPQPIIALEDSTDTEEAPIDLPAAKAAVQSSTLSVATETTLPSPTVSPTAERYFEYSIHQSVSLSPSSTTTTELSAQPFTTLDSANAQTDKLFQSAKQQYELLGTLCKSTIIKTLSTGLSVYKATFISTEDPSKSLTLELWVERAEVGVCANHTPSPSTSPLISRTLYALRLWRLIEEATSSDSEAEDEDDATEKAEKQRNRIYQPLPHICTELHTSIDSANRAAKRVQIELSHEKEPKSMQAKWQIDNLRDLNEKLEVLKREVDESDEDSETPSLSEYEEGRRKGCWRSLFNGYGPRAHKFELLVASVGVSGPRNL